MKRFIISTLALLLIGNGCITYDASTQNLVADETLATVTTKKDTKPVSIKLDEYTYEQSTVPIRFTGEVSPNTDRIIVTFSSGTLKDVYTLENFHAGDLRFQYQANENWDNLKPGLNNYEFVAYGADGQTSKTTAKINYKVKSVYQTPTNPTKPATSTSPTTPTSTPMTSCCKYCSTGKACGDSCISKSYTCHKSPGCACNSY